MKRRAAHKILPPPFSSRGATRPAAPPLRRVVRRRAELDASGAAAGGEVKALAIEADRAPSRPRRFKSREPRDRGAAHGVDLGDEPLFGFRKRLFADARGEDVRRRQRAGAAEAAIEMHALDGEAEVREIGKGRVELRLGIALQIARLARAPSQRSIRPPSVKRGWLSGSPRSWAPVRRGSRADRGRDSWCGATASTSGTGARRRNRWPADQVVSGPPPAALERRQRGGAGEPHQPLGVGDGLGMGLARSDGAFAMAALRLGARLAAHKPGRPGQVRRPERQPRSLAIASNFMVLLHNSRRRPI